ncbi:MAG: alkaline phosphatase D family protein [Thermoanaerobaculales bacterium]|nr:alkaline phosphatase D family protein [Thermoanaerobaculales bacterium]
MKLQLRGLISFSILCGLILCIAGPVLATGTERFPQSVASGDPQSDSVVLWTRVADVVMEDALVVEMALDADFTDVIATRNLLVDDRFDGSVKVLMDGLEPYTDYWYRFVYGSGAAMDISTVGRTRTAPSADDPRPMKFAVVYGQDFTGRYYNSYLKLLRDHGDDLDFIVHVGDYVYETTGDPTFQDPTSERKIEFDDTEGAIAFGSGDATYYAASSLANYRTLYRTFRSDPMLQEVHERWPMVVIWDDHEFSDDCWGATATYFDEKIDETDVERRRRSEQAFFEWIPISAGLGEDGTLAIDDSMLYPNSVIYRDFRFGAHLALAMTDYRTYRPDHLVAEDAFPGAVAVDEPTLRQMLGDATFEALKDGFDPYINMDVVAANLPILKQTCSLILAELVAMENPGIESTEAVAYANSLLTGNISTFYINSLFEAGGLTPVFVGEIVTQMEHGLPYVFVGKTSLNDSLGSRYMLLKQGFDLLAGARFVESGGAAQDVYGAAQLGWLASLLIRSDATWNVVASSTSMTPMVLDFSHPAVAPGLPPEFPQELRTQILVNVDQWDGFPQSRETLQWIFSSRPNTVVISGDIHSWFVTDHQNGLIEFTAPAISSESLEEMILGTLQSHPILGQIPGLEQLVATFGPLMQLTSLDDTITPSDIVDLDLRAGGYMVVDVNADTMTTTMVYTGSEEARNNYYETPEIVDDIFQMRTFRVEGGQVTLVDP